MSDTHPLAHVSGLSFRFMSAIIFWNHAEATAKQIAQLLLGESAMSMAVTAELGNRTLMQAIEVASHEMEELGPHLRHFSKGYLTLLGYRNFYVHAIYSTRPSEHDPANSEAVLFTLDGRGRLRFFNRALTETELDKAISAIHQLLGYGVAIQKELGATGDGLEGLIHAYQATLEMPQWPPDVEKTPLYLEGQNPPPSQPKRIKRKQGGGAK